MWRHVNMIYACTDLGQEPIKRGIVLIILIADPNTACYSLTHSLTAG